MICFWNTATTSLILSNKMMIDEVKEEGELPIGKDYKELFVSKAADGRLLIHQGLLQYMLKHADRKNLYYCMLDEYLSSLLDLEMYQNLMT